MTRSKTARPRTTRYVRQPRYISVADWVRDYFAAHGEPSTLTGTSAYLVGMDHQWLETDIWLRAQVQDGLRPHVLALQTLSQQLAMAPSPPPEPERVDLDLIHPGEVHLPAERVRDRRMDEQAAQDQDYQEQLARHAQLRADLRAEIAHHTAVIEEAWALAVADSARTAHYYQRRAAAYCRMLHRRGIPVAVLGLTAPTWTTEPCPWTALPILDPGLELTA
jgi:hypothetical protein